MKALNSITSWSWNVNGLRSCLSKGFLNVLQQSNADLFLLQETRAFEKDLAAEQKAPANYTAVFFPAQKPGYSGVAVYSRLDRFDQEARLGLGYPEFDAEGRWLEMKIKSLKCVYISAYFPNSQRLGARLGYKINFCNAVSERLNSLTRQGYSFVLAGDLNIAHEPRDLANPKQNERNAGYLPEERQWFSSLISEGNIDTFRKYEKDSGHYTWWSSRAGVREKNIGWRLDYHIASANLSGSLKSSRIHSQIMGSDHCPVSLEIATQH